VTAPSAMIKDMKSMPWSLALVVTVTVLVIGTLAILDKDVNVVMNAILFLLMALGYAELREVRSNTNGTNTKLMEDNTKLKEELYETRIRQLQDPQSPTHLTSRDHAP
jgi:hypothetical protein